ncbi:suppressor APC domain-containing protein 2 [Epargyreus clarus]|uniref:suppressor APC domain-containing protein 2 n=1 Tax=Epargyreus clarus TaxID=520877 RepID=UPI003C2E8C50
MDSLPKQFVSAMRTLFDIMDDKQTGYVKLTDIENRWRDDRTKGLPRGVIESLQKVASHDGLLTFECFCTGLKICLLRNQVQNASNKVNKEDMDIAQPLVSAQVHHTSSIPLIDGNNTQNRDRNWNAIRNNGGTAQQRTNSMPQLIEDKDNQLSELLHSGTGNTKPKNDSAHRIYGPPKPPRLEKPVLDRKETIRTNYNSEDIALDGGGLEEAKLDFDVITRSMEGQDRGLGDGRSANETQTQMRRTTRRREPRRHTLHNGIDYNLLKRMKQIEQEKDILLQGLTAVEEAREWYLKQLTEVQEKMRYAGRMGAYVEPWNEAHQERLELLRARVLELNRQLGALAVGWRHGPLSLHMNLALPTTLLNTPATPNNASVLRSQNRLLAEEVNKKNERISVLEREKSALIRELLLQRNRTKLLDTFT